MRRDARAVRCEDAASALVELADGGVPEQDELARHVEQCLRCQVELTQHRRIGRSLTQLRSVRTEPPADLVLGILATVAAAGDQRDLWSAVLRHRATYVAAAATATAAGAAGAFVLTRSRRLRLAPTG